MIVENGTYLDPNYSWIAVKVKGPYNKDSYEKVFIRPFTFRENNYFEKLIESKAPTKDKFYFTITNCVSPKIDLDTALVGTLNTLYNICLFYSGWTYDRRFKIKGAKTVEERAGEWCNSLRGIEQTLCVALLEGCTFRQLDNCDQLEYIKIVKAMHARYQAVFGDEKYQWFMEQYYGQKTDEPGYEIKQDYYADPGTSTTKGYEVNQTTLVAKRAPTKTIQEINEDIKQGRIKLPDQVKVDPFSNAF